MRNLLIASAAWLALAAAPLAAHAAGPATGDVAKLTVAQSQSGTVLPGVIVTAPALPPMNPWDISTWRFRAGAGPDHPEGHHGYGAGTGGGGGSGAGVVVSPPPR